MDLIILGALVVGLTEVVKRTAGIKNKFIPLTSLVLTMILFVVYVLASKTAIDWEMIQNVLIVALSSVGLYSGVKNTLQ